MHRGPWSAGPSRGNAAALQAVAPVAAAHGVAAIVSGHDNIYEHGVGDGGVPYFVTGGGGAVLDSVTPRATTVTARALPHYLLLTVDAGGATVRAKDAGGVVFDEVAL
jgi:hypothetical protein